MLKAFVILHRRPDLTWDAFSRYWRDIHGPLVRELPGLRYYAQFHTPKAFFGGATPCDGIAEVWFDDRAALHAAFASPAGQAVLDDNPNFVDDARTKLVIADEVVLVGST